jgi:hypothetical protein
MKTNACKGMTSTQTEGDGTADTVVQRIAGEHRNQHEDQLAGEQVAEQS